MPQNAIAATLKTIALDGLGQVIAWPLWWYTLGIAQLLRLLWGSLIEQEQRLGVGLWWVNLLTPMYGQTDWQGRLISFCVRLVVGLGRSALLLVWLVLLLAVLAVWVTVLPLSAYFIWDHLTYFFDIRWG